MANVGVNTRGSLKPETESVKSGALLANLREGAHQIYGVKAQRSTPSSSAPMTIQRTTNLSLASLVAAAGLGQATADQVTDRQQGDQEPALIGTEPLTVLVHVDHQRGDQDTED